MHETPFRLSSILILLSAIAISIYFRRKADRETGEKPSTRDEGTATFLALRLGGLVLWLSPLIYALNPSWMEWSRIGLPHWLRWAAVASGVSSLGLIAWMFRSLGTGITPTVATRTEHKLSTSGPYRWIRHPLYTFGTFAFVSLGVLVDSWFVLLLAAFAFVMLASRTPNEEAHLVAKFGNDYRDYMNRTGRYLPKVRGSTIDD